ncbi:MAG TPA: hypothetical protein VHD63_13865 [Ktedonobacteraceae bacterium]|nr:hypothetical protein [Ktedonobacteraceae bacterium]
MLAVLHFGGQTLITPAHRQQFLTQVQQHLRQPETIPLVVVSPLEGIPARLHTLARLVREGKAEAATAWGEQIIQTHRGLARDILRDSFPPATHLPLLEEALRQFAEDLMLLQFLPYGSVSVPAQITRLVTWGARLAAILGALVLEKAGLPAWPLPEPAIVTAHPDPDTTQEGLRMAPALLAPTRRHAFRLVLPVLSRQQIPVIAGGGATTEWGGVTLLAPGEEELTAALLAVVFRARSLTLYTTQPGLLSADPALIPEASPVPVLSAEEALCPLNPVRESAFQQMLMLLATHQIPLHLRSLREPDLAGTRIHLIEPASACTALALHPAVALVTLKGRACTNLAEHLPVLLHRVSQTGVTPMMAQLVTSQRLSLLVEARMADAVQQALRDMSEAGDVTCQMDLAVCWCIGATIGRDPLTLASAVVGLHEARIAIVHQGFTDLGMGIVVTASQGRPRFNSSTRRALVRSSSKASDKRRRFDETREKEDGRRLSFQRRITCMHPSTIQRTGRQLQRRFHP